MNSPDFYMIVATRAVAVPGGWTRTEQVPTFCLPTHILGIVSEDHAARIARKMLGEGDGVEVHVTAQPWED